MKKIGLLFLAIPFLISTSCEREDKCFNQIHGICIPNSHFFDELIRDGVDKNGDGHISGAEAEAKTKLEIVTTNVADMTGIEAFVNLDTLICSGSYFDLGNGALTSLDVSNNTALKYLRCTYNRLTKLDLSNNAALNVLNCRSNYTLSSLDISNCVDLTYLDCSNNQLTSIDVTNNTELTYLDCVRNKLTNLNVSNSPSLTELQCSGNQLTYLDISRNSKITRLSIWDMPNLSKVCVWEIPFPPEGVHVTPYGSPNLSFTTDCSN